MADNARVQVAIDQFSDQRWRLNNLYWITDKEGARVKFEMNWAQQALFDQLHFQNVVLKARQFGFTTFIQLVMLDACIFNSNIRAGTIAHTLGDAIVIFRDKVKYPYDNLPEQLRRARATSKDTANELLFNNNSSIRVGTSLRSGTLQYLHVSEYGKLCSKYPEKAREVRTGALNTVDAGQIVFIESTAEGQEGHYYEICQSAQSKQNTGEPLTALDFKFFFYPWWKNPDYALSDTVATPAPLAEYFAKLQTSHGIDLTREQRAWYVKKYEQQAQDMKREYPSTPGEAFEASLEGAYYAEQIAKAELDGRIGAHKLKPELPVNTVWDIGRGDQTAIWFWQHFGNQIGVVGYYANSGEGMPFYAKKLKEFQERKGFARWGEHWFPHDAKVEEWGTGRTRLESLISQDIRPELVPDHSVDDGINAAREIFGICWFDAEECADGLKALKAYRKEWDEKHGVWKDTPRHDWASDGSDSFRYLAMAYRERVPKAEKPKGRTLNNGLTLNDLWKAHEKPTYSRI